MKPLAIANVAAVNVDGPNAGDAVIATLHVVVSDDKERVECYLPVTVPAEGLTPDVLNDALIDAVREWAAGTRMDGRCEYLSRGKDGKCRAKIAAPTSPPFTLDESRIFIADFGAGRST
jgi:hypothetical protein